MWLINSDYQSTMNVYYDVYKCDIVQLKSPVGLKLTDCIAVCVLWGALYHVLLTISTNRTNSIALANQLCTNITQYVMHITSKCIPHWKSIMYNLQCLIVSKRRWLFFFIISFDLNVEKCQIDALNKCQLDLHVTTSNIRLHDNRIKYSDTK